MIVCFDISDQPECQLSAAPPEWKESSIIILSVLKLFQIQVFHNLVAVSTPSAWRSHHTLTNRIIVENDLIWIQIAQKMQKARQFQNPLPSVEVTS